MASLSAKDLHQIFQDLDQNGDGGLLSVDELNWLLERMGVHLSQEELESSVRKSSLNFNEFLAFYDSIAKEDNEEEVKDGNELMEAFNVFDMNGDGFISCSERQNVMLRLGLWNENSGKDCAGMICKYDTNFDGMVDFEEFKNMMLQQN